MRWFFLLTLVANIAFFIVRWPHYLSQQGYNNEMSAAFRSDSLGGKRLVLLSEVQEQTEENPVVEYSNNSASEAQLIHTTMDESEVCTFLGPLKDSETTQQLQQRLIAVGIRSEIITEKIKIHPDYWVYLPPLASRTLAIRLLRELKERDIESFVINEGDLKNGLSLGLFTREKAAESVKENIRMSGYDAKIRVVPRSRNEFWVELSSQSTHLFSDELWGNIQQQFSLSEKRQKLCKSVASVP